MPSKQETVRVGRVRKDFGFIRHLAPTADNRAFVVLYEDEAGDHHVVFGDRVCEEFRSYELMRWSLSFDGKRLAAAAVTWDAGNRRHSSGIRINGEPAFAAGVDVVANLDWLDNDRLAWVGWNADEHGRVDGNGIRRFVNGRDVTDELDFEPVLAERMRHAIHVREGDVAYVIHDDGSRSVPVKVDAAATRSDWSGQLWPSVPRDDPERVQVNWDEARRRAKVSYRGVTGPAFDGIDASNMHSYAFNVDRSRVAYVGVRYGRLANALGRVVSFLLDRIDGERRGRLAKLMGWPIAMLFNPYFGLGHAYIENSKRFVPVDHDRPWKKKYRYATDPFYTPDGRLVVTAGDGRRVRVVLDEEEDPFFDAVYNVRASGDGGVSYLALSGDDIFRITTK